MLGRECAGAEEMIELPPELNWKGNWEGTHTDLHILLHTCSAAAPTSLPSFREPSLFPYARKKCERRCKEREETGKEDLGTMERGRCWGG